MDINVFSYAEARAKFSEDNPYWKRNWISIRDIGYDYVYWEMDKICENVLILKFDDVTRFNAERGYIHQVYKDAQKERDLVFFDEEMADKIVTFAESIKDGWINIHCWAGLSRSQAVGFCLNTYFNLYKENNKAAYERNLRNSFDKFLGNYDVIRILTERLYGL